MRLGKYQLTVRLGQGGMGVVYQARDTVLHRLVALKLLPESLGSDPASWGRILREAQAAARLNHPHVVALHDVGPPETPYLVLEYVPGGSAQDRLDARGRFPWAEATRLAAQACRGLAAAHAAGLIHRDVKPANLLLGDGGVKLADFGLAKVMNPDGSLNTPCSVLGTPQYMSPEQCRGDAVDPRTDLYSLGAAYYALLTGRPPFDRSGPMLVLFAQCTEPLPDPRALAPDVPAGCVAVLRRATAKERADRYPSAAAMLADLEEVLAPAAAVPGPSPEPPPAPSRRVPWWAWAAVLLAAAAGVAALAARLLGLAVWK
jgi:serine/threonine protein kinase